MAKENPWRVRAFYGLFVTITLIMVARVFYGIEITDEAYYLAEARTVYEGNWPYALNNSNSVGMTMVMMPFVWLFKQLSADYEGFFLYMRLCFILYKCILLLIAFYLLKRRVGVCYAATSIILIAAFPHIHSILNFSYNTISALNVFLAGMLLFTLPARGALSRSQFLGYFIAGVFSSIAVFAHPLHAFTVFLFLAVLIGFKYSCNRVLAYVLGGVVLTCAYFASIIAQSGLTTFVDGFIAFLGNADNGYIHKPGFTKNIILIWSRFHILWAIMFGTLVSSFVAFCFIEKRNTKCQIFGWHGRAKHCFDTVLTSSLSCSLVAGVRVHLSGVPPSRAVQLRRNHVCHWRLCFVCHLGVARLLPLETVVMVSWPPSACFLYS